MDSETQVQNLDEAVYISQNAKTLRNGMNPIILLPAIDK